MAGALVELARTGLDQEYRAINPGSARVILVQCVLRMLPIFSAILSSHAGCAGRGYGMHSPGGSGASHTCCCSPTAAIGLPWS